MRLGIDFGTTNSAAAIFDGQALHPIRIAPSEQPKSPILPSLIYINREHHAQLGFDAAGEYARRETGRPVHWRRRSVGSIETWFASTGSSPMLVEQEVIVTWDDAAFGRLLQSVKTVLRNPYYSGTQIFDRFYTVDELIALILKQLKDCAEAQLNDSCSEVVIGRPVKFSDDERISTRAEEIIYKAARLAGFRDIAFRPEPIGALYVYHVAAATRQRALVFDFGGGTLDLTIAEVGAGEAPHVLATRGVLVGGDDLDKRIMLSLYKYFGDDPKRDLKLPNDFLDLLASWQTMPELSRPQYEDMLRTVQRSSPHPETLDALWTLVSKNMGFSLFSEIEQAKKQLSSDLVTTLKFNHGAIRIHERITRSQFESMIRQEIKLVRDGIAQVLEDADLTPDQIDVVLRTGGSSLVPAFENMLSDLFGDDKIQEMDPLVSVVGGLGIIAHEDNGLRGTYRSKYVERPQDILTRIQTSGDSPYETYFMKSGAECYVDQDTTIRKVPVELTQLPTLKTAYGDRENADRDFLRFRLAAPARVYVAYQSSAFELPRWLAPFLKHDSLTIELDSEWWGVRELQVYSQTFPAGEVTLGGNAAPGMKGKVDAMYLVIVEKQAE